MRYPLNLGYGLRARWVGTGWLLSWKAAREGTWDYFGVLLKEEAASWKKSTSLFCHPVYSLSLFDYGLVAALSCSILQHLSKII
jgi:hypothetical protein